MADFLGEGTVDSVLGGITATQCLSGQAPSGLEPTLNESGLFSSESVFNTLKLIFAGAPLSEVLTIIARLVETQGERMLCTIWLLDKDERHLRCATAPSLPAQYIAQLDGTPVGPKGCNCGTAVYRREPVYVTDIVSDPLWDDYRHLALPYGLRACWSRPLISSKGKVLGTFASYYREVRSPDPTDLQLIESASQLVSIAIERAQDEAALKGSEARKTAILDSALDCIVTIDREGGITEFNPAAERTFGTRRDEVVGKNLADVIIPLSLREKHRRGLARYLARGESRVLGRRVEMTAVRADGSEFPVELAITRIPLDGPPSFTVYLRDITERKQAIDERERVEIRLAGEKRLLEMVASGCSLPDVLAALCSFVEDTATECHCVVSLIDWSGLKFRSIVAPTVPATFNDAMYAVPVRCEAGPCARAACLKTQVIAVDMESDPLWQESPVRALALAHGVRSCWSTPIYSLAGHVLGTFAILQHKPARPTPLQQDLIAQVTHIASIAIERAQGEAALKRSEAFLAEGQRLSLTGSFSWRVATDEITWSDQVYRIFEIDPGMTVTLELIATRVHPEDIQLLNEMIDWARGDGSDFEYEHRLQMPDRSVKYLHIVAHGTRDQDGRLEYIGAIQDVTERRLSEAALSKARSELAHVARVTSLGVMTASIAHEVNQPLSGIITNASTCLRMLAADPPNVDGARETARRTIRDGNRASEVITRLRALFGKKDATADSVDLNEATREVIALSSSELQRGRVIIRAELGDDIPLVTGDRVQLQQVILNLLQNASDAMSAVDDRPRQLLIRTERDEGDRVRLTVEDAGVGFDPQAADRLFEAFYTTKNYGMGIGLSVSRSIIESHHGRLWAAPNDGPGATFSFSIPRRPEAMTSVRCLGAIRTPVAANAQLVMRNL